MSAKQKANEVTLTGLLKELLALELWRAGLSQAEIRKRLGVGINTVNQMLKGVSREVVVRIKPAD